VHHKGLRLILSPTELPRLNSILVVIYPKWGESPSDFLDPFRFDALGEESRVNTSGVGMGWVGSGGAVARHRRLSGQ
jgi:hypothetical protein